ncbi:MAG: hypothetical protein HZA89_08405 [Verrucomicrobia bacterium]|nr:hypothetical protein [Verrucomicrobiota bacterium]
MGKFSLRLVWLALLGGVSAGLANDAVIEGTVRLNKPPVAAPPSAQRYQAGSVQPAPPPPSPMAVVYLEGTFPAPATNPPTVRLGQMKLQFETALLPVQKGTLVEFPNTDDVYHNVFSYSKTKRFDLGRYLKDEKPAAQRFDQPGVVNLYCEIHEHMRGVILVLDTPYFTKTDTNGVFRLENLPAGKFTLKAWLNEKTPPYSLPVELAPGAKLRVDLPGQ